MANVSNLKKTLPVAICPLKKEGRAKHSVNPKMILTQSFFMSFPQDRAAIAPYNCKTMVCHKIYCMCTYDNMYCAVYQIKIIKRNTPRSSSPNSSKAGSILGVKNAINRLRW